MYIYMYIYKKINPEPSTRFSQCAGPADVAERPEWVGHPYTLTPTP